jgi:hypothetical protein
MNKLEIKESEFSDLVMRDKYVYPEIMHPLEKAIQSIKDKIIEDPALNGIIEELAEYTTDRPGRQIIGVEAKLRAGGRDDAVENAIYLKNKFERKLAKNQLSNVEQHIYAHVLGVIEVTFNQYVRPLIINGSGRDVVDATIHREIYEPVYKAIVSFDVSIDMKYVAGMLYFLTGKCHLIWSE